MKEMLIPLNTLTHDLVNIYVYILVKETSHVTTERLDKKS